MTCGRTVASRTVSRYLRQIRAGCAGGPVPVCPRLHTVTEREHSTAICGRVMGAWKGRLAGERAESGGRLAGAWGGSEPRTTRSSLESEGATAHSLSRPRPSQPATIS